MKSLKIFFSVLIFVGAFATSSRADLVLDYTDGSPALGWLLPHPQGVTHMAMRFTNQTAVACTLKTVHAGLLDDPDFFNDTTGDLFFTIYTADAAGFPDSFLYLESVPNADFVGGFDQPINVVSLDVSFLGLTFPTGGQWIVSVTTDQKSVSSGDSLIFASDNGAKPSLRWYEYAASAGWQRANCCHDGLDVNMHIYSTITSPAANKPPEFVSSNIDQFVDEGDLLEFSVNATDPDQDFVTMTMESVDLPVEATFEQVGNFSGFGAFSWPTDFDDAGSYTAIFIATDPAGATAVDTIKITVNNVNRPPVLSPIGSQFVLENENLYFEFFADDADGTTPTLNTSVLPEGASIAVEGSFGSIGWTPTFAQAGEYPVNFYASDGIETDSETITITVNDVPCPDFSIANFSLSGPPMVSYGRALNQRIMADVRSSGDVEYGDSVFAGFYISTDSIITTSDLLLTGGRETVGPIPLNGIVNVPGGGIIPFTYPTGPAYLGFIIEEQDDVVECNEENNTAAIAVDVVNNISPYIDPPLEDVNASETDVIEFMVFGYDPDLGTLYLSMITNELPSHAVFTDNLDGTGTFNWPTTYQDSGHYRAVFNVSDDREDYVEDTVDFTIANVNQPPVLDPIGDKLVNENEILTFPVNASDFDEDCLNLSMINSNLPPEAIFNYSGDCLYSGNFEWAPTFNDSGIYTATFIASDGADADSETITITVSDVPCADFAIAEFSLNNPQMISFDRDFGSRLNILLQKFAAADGLYSLDFNFYYSDEPTLDGLGNEFLVGSEQQTLVFSAAGVPVKLSTPISIPSNSDITLGPAYFIMTINQTNFFTDCNPQNNLSAFPFELVFNIDPVLDSIGNKPPVDEGQTLAFGITSSDADGDSLVFDFYSLPPLPGSPVLVDSGNGSAYFEWTPGFSDAGEYSVTFRVFDSYKTGGSFDEETIIITVNNLNRRPVLNVIGPWFIPENSYREFDVTGSDPDTDDVLEFTTSALPIGASFFSSSGGHTFAWQPNSSQVGSYSVTFYVSDGLETDSDVVIITVENVPCPDFSIADFSLDDPQQISFNRPLQSRLNLAIQNSGETGVTDPVEIDFFISQDSAVGNCDCNVVEIGDHFENSVPLGGPFSIDISADSISLSFGGVFGPGLAWLCVQIDGANEYNDCNPDNNFVCVPVELVFDIPPVLNPIGDKQVDEGETLNFTISSYDPDIIDQIFLYMDYYDPSGNLQPTFVDNYDGTGHFEWITDFNDQGDYTVTFYASNSDKAGGSDDRETITITVNNINRPPVLDSIENKFVDEGSTLAFNVSASDLDEDCLSLSMLSSDLPKSAIFTDIGDCTNYGQFTWQTTYADAGVYTATFYASDGIDADSQTITISVGSVNRPPVLNPVNDTTINENQQLNLTIFGSDPDSEQVFFEISDQPGGSSLVDNGDGSATFSWTPTFDESGVEDVIFTVKDIQGEIDEDTVTITVNNVNRPPVLDPINDTVIVENQTLNITLTASDPDGDQLSYFLEDENIPSAFIFDDSGNGLAYFEWTPTYNEAGQYELLIYLDDNRGPSIEIILAITVNNVNRPPVLDLIGDQFVCENETLVFQISAFDPDGDCLSSSISSPGLPGDPSVICYASCLDSCSFEWTPGCNDAGVYTVIFFVDDGNVGTDSNVVSITVNSCNAPPVFNDVEDVFVDENIDLIFLVSATDCDGTNPVLSSLSLPQGATFSGGRNGTGTFIWKPDCNQNGPYVASFLAVDDSTAADTQFVSINVREVCDADLTVVKTPCVGCTPPENFTDILVSDDKFSIEFNIQIFAPSIAGNISIKSARGSLPNHSYNPNTKTIDITPEYGQFGDFAPIDTIIIELTQGIRDLADSSLDSTYNLTYLTGPVVYPGDCNNDGTVNEIDVLSIGLFWDKRGPDREVGGEYYLLDFFAQPAHFEEQGNGKWEPFNGVYADVDGSGIVDANDLCGIAINFAKTVISDIAPKAGGELNQSAALSQVGSTVLEQMRDALIECPDSAPKTKMLEAINNARSASTAVLPTEIELHQNYPNPFNPATTIEFSLPKAEHAVLEIYNMLGQRVVTLVDEKVEAGYKMVVWNGTDYTGKSVASGIYFYRLNTETKEIIKRMLLIK